MREDEVPQDNSSTYAGHKKVLYARTQAGSYAQVQSSGWEAEATATLDAVALYEELAAEALSQARLMQVSPLAYHMYQRRMDLLLLSQTTGLWRWRIRRHLQPKYFNRLSDSLRARYAAALNLAPDQLAGLPEHDS